MDKIILRKSLQELRDSIDLVKKVWTSKEGSNCYAYALGLDMNEYEITDTYSFCPGVIGGDYSCVSGSHSYENLIRCIIADLNALGIDYSSADPKEPPKRGEWKVALFLTDDDPIWINDFHFLRQHPNGSWFHKKGYGGDVLMCDDDGTIITNPEKCHFSKYSIYDSCFRLKLK